MLWYLDAVPAGWLLGSILIIMQKFFLKQLRWSVCLIVGFFLDYEAPSKKYHSGIIWVFEYMNATSGVHQGCIAGYPVKEQWHCMFAQYTAPFIKTPMFPLQAEYDSWQTGQDLASTDATLINQWGANLTTLIQNNFLKNP